MPEVIKLTYREHATLDILKRCQSGKIYIYRTSRGVVVILVSNTLDRPLLLISDVVFSLIEIKFLTINQDGTFLITQTV